jgi:hypothetical protein
MQSIRKLIGFQLESLLLRAKRSATQQKASAASLFSSYSSCGSTSDLVRWCRCSAQGDVVKSNRFTASRSAWPQSTLALDQD